MRSKAEIQKEINKVKQQIEAITVGGSPIEGYEAEYAELQQWLSALQELLATEEPAGEPPTTADEAPLLSRWLQKARRLTDDGQFAQALEALDEAEKYTGEQEDRLAIVAEARRQVERAREAWKKERAERIQQALADEAQPLPEEIETWIEEYWAKAPDQESQVEDWLTAVSARRRLDAAAQAAETLRQELEPLWAECERAIAEGKIVAAAEPARRAVSRVHALQQEYPQARPVLALVQTAEGWNERAKGPQATAVQTADFQHLLEEYENLKSKGHDRLPRFQAVREAGRLRFTTDERGQEILELQPGWEKELVPAVEAIRELETLATEYACQKAEEKLELAKQAMPRDPRRAQASLEEGRRLFVPEARQQDIQWLAWLEKIETYNHIAVQPAVTHRGKAERRRDAAPGVPDVLKAWDELGKVQELDPHVPLLDQARASLHDRLIFRINEALEEAQRLRRLRRWREAQQVVEPFLARTRQDKGLAEWTQRLEEFTQDCEQGARDEESTLKTMAEIQALVDRGRVQEAHERLAALEGELGENVSAYPQAGRLRDRIDARRDLQALLDRAALVHDAATSDEELQAASDVLEEALEEHTAHPQILGLQKRLRARLLFRQAEREYGAASFTDVRAWYRSVIELGGDDADEAEQRLEQMSKDEEETEDVERTLAAAQGHLKEKRYRQACELLQPLADRRPPVPQHRRVWKLLGEAKEGLIGEIESESRVLQQRGRRRLDTWSIFEKVDELAELDPERARKWDELVARCYMQLAQEAPHAEEALKHWQEARKCATSDSRWYSTIVAGLRQADRQVEFRKVDALLGAPEQARGLLEKLLARYPDDAEVRLRLADAYLRGGNLAAARIQWESAGQLLAQAADDAAIGLSGQLAEVQERLERAERLQREQKRIEARLKPENPLGDFQWARRRYDHVRRGEGPVHQRALDDWWEALIDRVIEELEAEWEEQQEEGAPRWRAAGPMLKILELRKEHGRAQEALREVARESLGLHSRVERMLHRTTGPPGVPPEDALRRQIDEAAHLLEEARAYEEVFKRRRGQLGDLQPTDLDGQVARTRGWWDRLVTLNQLTEEARGTLRTAMRTGEQRHWELGEELIQQISGTFDRSAPGAAVSPHVRPADSATFAAHPTVRLLIDEFRSAKATRARLESYLEELPRAWEREDFARVRWLIRELRQEDPGGQKYGLSNRRVPVRVEMLDRLELELDRLEELVAQREEQLGALEGWAEATRQVIPWRALPLRRDEMLPEIAGQGASEVVETLEGLQRAVQSGDLRGAGHLYSSLPVPTSGTGIERSARSAEPLSQVVEQAIRRAAFREALELCLKALCGSRLPPAVSSVLQGEWPDLRQVVERWHEVRDQQEGGLVSIQGYGSRDMWSLVMARRWLEEPPLETGDRGRVLCRRAGLIVARGMALAREIDAWVTEVQAQLDTVPATEREFGDLLQSARDNITRAGTLRRWWNRGERKRFLEAAQVALDEAGRLCRESVDLKDLQNLLNTMW